ncbi:hypothetical protein BDV95DRAFT_15516 [Massariosphaeria phaeospora]|uniref:Xylanolytic transcriptional activator regulatory domain-containing protein n=1 Tax=Massariosphaeria phaeospora TaxID=100035 RepID=A0A7C8IFA8_9PLEO|nr:hypothetical protein BDV95DRAFT_15516 [Massariosphaeria phaeospora]
MFDSVALNATLPLEVIRVIQLSRQSIDEIDTRYFNGLHLWVPFLCPRRFRRDLTNFQSIPTAEFSLIIFCMSLITYDPRQYNPPPIGHDTLYFHAKTLFTQLQVSRRPSIQLIQAGILIAIYEYAHGRPDSALASIDICARMAYKAGIHQKPENPGWNEAWNTWWAIRIFERVFYCETTLTDLPLISSPPAEAELLPCESRDFEGEENPILSCQGFPVNLVGIGCFGRAAQATYLLDRVIQMIKCTEPTDLKSRIVALDQKLLRLLATTMDRCHDHRRGHCGAVCISIRALFILHQHVLHLNTTHIASECRQHSQSALDTVTQMILDIARNHHRIHGPDVDAISPVYNYIVRHTLQYLYEKRYPDSDAWFQESDTLRQSLAKLNRRWPVDPGISFEL